VGNKREISLLTLELGSAFLAVTYLNFQASIGPKADVESKRRIRVTVNIHCQDLDPAGSLLGKSVKESLCVETVE
jgi:hypothetical protein